MARKPDKCGRRRTLRLPDSLLQRAEALARARRISFSRLVRESLSATVAAAARDDFEAG